MVIKFNAYLDNKAIENNLTRLINQIYKLLPMREEKLNWQKKINLLVEEFAGMDEILVGQHEILFQLLCKLQGLQTLIEDDTFNEYRSIVFECISLVGELKNGIC